MTEGKKLPKVEKTEGRNCFCHQFSHSTFENFLPSFLFFLQPFSMFRPFLPSVILPLVVFYLWSLSTFSHSMFSHFLPSVILRLVILRSIFFPSVILRSVTVSLLQLPKLLPPSLQPDRETNSIFWLAKCTTPRSHWQRVRRNKLDISHRQKESI